MTTLPVQAQDPEPTNVEVTQADPGQQEADSPAQTPAQEPPVTTDTTPAVTQTDTQPEVPVEEAPDPAVSAPAPASDANQPDESGGSTDTASSDQPDSSAASSDAATRQAEDKQPQNKDNPPAKAAPDTESTTPQKNAQAVPQAYPQVDPASIIAQIQIPRAGQSLHIGSFTLPENVTSVSEKWYAEPDHTLVAEGTAANPGTVYSVELVLSCSFGFETKWSSVSDGWKGISTTYTLTLSKTFEATGLEKLTVPRQPVDLQLDYVCWQFSTILNNNMDLVKSVPVTRANGEEIFIVFDYTCDDYNPARGAVNTASWTASISAQHGLDINDFELNIPTSGTITITNAPLKDPELEGWYSYAYYADTQFDITTSFLNKYKVPVSYFLILPDGTEQELYRGLMGADRAGEYIIEMRSSETKEYKAGSARSTFDLRKADITGMLSASRESWTYGQAPNNAQVEFESSGSIRSFDVSELREGPLLNTTTGITYDSAVDLPAGHYKGTYSLDPDHPKFSVPVLEYEFDVHKAQRRWSEQKRTRLETDETTDITIAPTGDGTVTMTSSDPAIAEITADGKLRGVSRGTATITIKAEGSQNYADDEISFDVKVGWITPEWSNISENKTVTYGDPAFSLNPVCTSDSSIQVEVDGDAISRKDDGSFEINHAGTATVRYKTVLTDNYYASSYTVRVLVDKKTITVQPGSATMIYGDEIPEITFSYEGEVEGDPVKGGKVYIPKDLGVGSHQISVDPDTGANPNYSFYTKHGTLTVEPRPVSISWTDTSLVYNGEIQKPTPHFTNIMDGDVLEPVISGGTKDIGSSQVTLESLGNPNYTFDPDEALCEYTIEKKDVTVRATGLTKIYGDSDPNLNDALQIEGAIGNELDGRFTVMRPEGEYAGVYPLHIAFDPIGYTYITRNYNITTEAGGTLTITKKGLTPLWSSTEMIYNAKPQIPSVSFEGLLEGDTCQANLSGEQVHAGTGYTARIESLSNPNYRLAEDASDSTAFSIEKKAALVTATSATKTYGDVDPAFAFTVDGLIGDEELSGITIRRKEGESVGSYALTPEAADDTQNSDYDLLFEQGILQITPRPVNVKWDTDTDLVYNGQAQAPAFELVNILDTDSVDGIISGKNIHAGENYQAKLDSLSNSNYVLAASADITQTYSIAPKPVTLTADAASKTYGDADPAFTFQANGLVDGDSLQNVTFARTPGENAGSYALNVQAAAADNPDYAISLRPAELSILPRPVTLAWEQSALIYNGTAQKPTVILGNLVGGDTCTATVTGAQTHAKDGYTASVTALSNPNYILPEDDSAQTLFSIAPKPASVTVNAAEKIYGDPDPAFSYSAQGLIDGDLLKDISFERAEGEDAGSYTVTPSAPAASNPDYALTFTDGSLTIAPRTVKAKWEETNLVYNAKSQSPALHLEGIVNGDTCKAVIEGAEIHAGKDYSAKAVALDNANYVLPSDLQAVTYSISPAPLTLSVRDAEKVYGDADPEFEASLSGWLEENDPELLFTREDGEDADTYTLSASIPGLPADYILHAEDGALTIRPRSIEDLSIILKDLLRESGQPLEQTIEELTWADAQGHTHPVTVEADNHVQSAGGAYVMTLKGIGNYEGSLSQSFVVLPASGPTFPRQNETTAKIGKGSLDLAIIHDTALPEPSVTVTHEDILNRLADQGLISAAAMADIADGEQKHIALHFQDRSSEFAPTVPEDKASATATAITFQLNLEHPFGNAGISAHASAEGIPITLPLPAAMTVDGAQLSLYAMEGGDARPVSFARSNGGQIISFVMEPGQTLQLVSLEERKIHMDPSEVPSDKPSDIPSDSNSGSSSGSSSAHPSDSSSGSSSSSRPGSSSQKPSSTSSSGSSSSSSSKASAKPEQSKSSPNTAARELPTLIASFGAATASLLGLLHIGSWNRRKNRKDDSSSR